MLYPTRESGEDFYAYMEKLNAWHATKPEKKLKNQRPDLNPILIDLDPKLVKDQDRLRSLEISNQDLNLEKRLTLILMV